MCGKQFCMFCLECLRVSLAISTPPLLHGLGHSAVAMSWQHIITLSVFVSEGSLLTLSWLLSGRICLKRDGKVAVFRHKHSMCNIWHPVVQNHCTKKCLYWKADSCETTGQIYHILWRCQLLSLYRVADRWMNEWVKDFDGNWYGRTRVTGKTLS